MDHLWAALEYARLTARHADHLRWAEDEAVRAAAYKQARDVHRARRCRQNAAEHRRAADRTLWNLIGFAAI